MGSVGGKIDEEGSVVSVLDKADGSIREDVGTVSLVAAWLPIVLQHRVEVAITWRVGVEANPPAPVAKNLLEALIERPQGIVVAQMIFPEEPCAVAGFTEQFR